MDIHFPLKSLKAIQVLVCFILMSGSFRMNAATVVLSPVADTTLVEGSPTNNMGAQLFVNAGTSQQTNAAGVYTRNRGLFQFEFSSISKGSKIRDVNLTLEVVLQQTEPPTASDFDLHRVLKAWSEGSKTGTPAKPGQGAPATPGEATWNDRFAFTTNSWTVPGGAVNEDFAAEVSASAAVFDSYDSPYHFGTSPGMVADVQFWLNNPQLNYGWIFMTEAEAEPFTARRFGSREDPNHAPILQIEFVPPPRLQNPQVVSNRLEFSFTAEPDQDYLVQFSDALPATNWSSLTNIAAPAVETNIIVADTITAPGRFYRVVAP